MFQRTLRTLALTAMLLTAPWADEGFTNHDFKGDYAFHLDGVLSSSSGGPMVTAYDAAVGRFTADGAGNILQGTRSLSANGTIIDETFTCTYTVTPYSTGKRNVFLAFSA